MDLDAPEIERLMNVCKMAKLKAATPVYSGDAIAHVGLPSEKIAIFLRSVKDYQRIEAARDEWRKEGWGMLFITNKQIERTSDDELASHLKAAIKELQK